MYWYICLCTMCVQCQQRKEDHVRSSGITVKGSYELACGGWESNLCPLEEQLVFLTAKHHLSSSFTVFIF